MPLRPLVLIRGLCLLFGARNDVLPSFAPLARAVLEELEKECKAMEDKFEAVKADVKTL